MSRGTPNLTTPAKPPRSGGVWSYVSASRLNLWLKCPLAFKLCYVDGIRTPTNPRVFLGKRVHDGLEWHYRHRQLGILLETDAVLKRITDSWDQAVAADDVTFKNTAEEALLKRKAVDLVWTYLANTPQDEARPVLVETSLECPLIDPTTGEDLGIPLVGIVDLVLDADQGPVICDFKTMANSTAPLELAHEVQLTCYAYLLRRLTGQHESALEIRSLIKTREPKVEIHRYPARDEAHFRRLFAVIRAYLQDLHQGRFIYRPGIGCSYCDFRAAHCGSWQG